MHHGNLYMYICVHFYMYLCTIYITFKCFPYIPYTCLSLDVHFCWRVKLRETREEGTNDLSVRDLSLVFLFVLLHLEMLHGKVQPTFYKDVRHHASFFVSVYHASFFISVLTYSSFQSWQHYPVLAGGCMERCRGREPVQGGTGNKQTKPTSYEL